MKKILLIAIALFMCIDSNAQIDFPVYQPLPTVRPRTPPPMDNSYPRFDPTPPRSYNQPQQKTKSSINVLSKFSIEYAEIDGKDETKHYTSNNAYLAIYSEDDSQLLQFANCAPLIPSISSGQMIEPELNEYPETDTAYGYKLVNFKWNYSNSYDNVIGLAKVEIKIVNAKNKTTFNCTIVTKDTSIIFSGHLL